MVVSAAWNVECKFVDGVVIWISGSFLHIFIGSKGLQFGKVYKPLVKHV